MSKPTTKTVSGDQRMPAIRRYFRSNQDVPILQKPENMEEQLLIFNRTFCVPPLSSPKELADIHNLAYGVVPRKVEEIPGVPSNVATKALEIVRGDSVTMKRINWLWFARIPYGMLSVFAGNPDQGKSLVTLFIVAVLTTGGVFPDCPDEQIEPCEVLIFSGEDEPETTLVPRLKAAGANLSRVHIAKAISTKDGLGKTLEEREAQFDKDIVAIEEILRRNRKIQFAIVDPLSNYLGSANMNKEQDVRNVLIPLKSLAARTGVAITAVMHLNKNSDSSAIHRIGGAVAFTGVARAAWLFVNDPENKDEHFMLRVKNNLAKRGGGLKYVIETTPVLIEGEQVPMPIVKWNGITDATADDLLLGIPNDRGPGAGKCDDASSWLLDFLSSGPESASDVIQFGKKEGFSYSTLKRAKTELKIEAYQEYRRWFWRLPAVLPQAVAETETQMYSTPEDELDVVEPT